MLRNNAAKILKETLKSGLKSYKDKNNKPQTSLKSVLYGGFFFFILNKNTRRLNTFVICHNGPTCHAILNYIMLIKCLHQFTQTQIEHG